MSAAKKLSELIYWLWRKCIEGKDMIAVIAHQKKHFDDWLSGWIDSVDISKFVFVNRIDHIRGREFSEVIRIGPYWHLNNADELYEQAVIRKKK